VKAFSELKDDINKTEVDLLLTDAEMALTFLDLADATKDVDSKSLRQREAHKAYQFIVGRRSTLSLTTQQTILLNRRLAMLRIRLPEQEDS
jgi:hypothetical protein